MPSLSAASPRTRRVGFALFTIFWLASLAIVVAAALAGTFYQMEEVDEIGNATRRVGLPIDDSNSQRPAPG